MSQVEKRVVLDVDVGIDDYVALLIFFIAKIFGKVTIEAIVCSAGNTPVENSCTNVVRLLEMLDRTDIPVYRGASKHLIPLETIPYYFGSDGLGDLNYSSTPNMNLIRRTPASVAIANLILTNPNKITLVCLSPLTNLALSIRLYDKFADSVKDLWIMGGNYKSRGKNKTAEFNFYLDPEAAYIGFESIKKTIYLLTWETCLLPNISMDWHYKVLEAKDKPEINLLRQAEKNFYKKNETRWSPCDAFLAAAFLYPEQVITKMSIHNASVDLHGGSTRGQLILDPPNFIKENLVVIDAISTRFFKKIITEL